MSKNSPIIQTTSAVIRAPRPEDLPRLLEMIQALAKYHGDVANLTLARLEDDLFGTPPWITGLVAVKEGQPVGYATLCARIKLHYGKRGMDLHHLYVDQSVRGIGVGRQLIDACFALAQSKGCSFVTVGTTLDNYAAQKTYLAAGFQPLSSDGRAYSKSLSPAD